MDMELQPEQHSVTGGCEEAEAELTVDELSQPRCDGGEVFRYLEGAEGGEGLVLHPPPQHRHRDRLVRPVAEAAEVDLLDRAGAEAAAQVRHARAHRVGQRVPECRGAHRLILVAQRAE